MEYCTPKEIWSQKAYLRAFMLDIAQLSYSNLLFVFLFFLFRGSWKQSIWVNLLEACTDPPSKWDWNPVSEYPRVTDFFFSAFFLKIHSTFGCEAP